MQAYDQASNRPATTVRGVLIGCGYFAQNHLHAWRDLGVEISAVCDKNGDRGQETAARHGISRVYQDADTMLRRERPDFVDIATTVETHRELVELAASLGIPAICQKPFALSLEDADAMVAACRRAAVPLMVHENFRWRGSILTAQGLLRDGAIGKPFFARISCRHDFDVYARQPYLATAPRFAILDVGVHLLDIARSLFGEVESLSATIGRANPMVVGEDYATLLLRHRDGATSIVDMSFYTHRCPQPFPEVTLEVDGDKGTLKLLEDYRMIISGGMQSRESSVEPQLLPWASRPWHDVQRSVLNIQRHWLDVLRTGDEPVTSGEDNRRTLQLALLAYDAAETHSTISVPMEVVTAA